MVHCVYGDVGLHIETVLYELSYRTVYEIKKTGKVQIASRVCSEVIACVWMGVHVDLI